jgi:adenosine kinase
MTKTEKTNVPAVPVEQAVDPTGAGDAFRAGLIKGIVTNGSLLESARLGTVCASFAVEKVGTQVHAFTMAEFTERYQRTFG